MVYLLFVVVLLIGLVTVGCCFLCVFFDGLLLRFGACWFVFELHFGGCWFVVAGWVHCGYRLFSGFVVGMFCCFGFVGNGWCGWWLNLLFSVLCLICFVIVGIVCLGGGEFVLVNGAVGAFVV